eukprot:scaffold3514_cov132-Isochrysis_galbana.AAC.5
MTEGPHSAPQLHKLRLVPLLGCQHVLHPPAPLDRRRKGSTDDLRPRNHVHLCALLALALLALCHAPGSYKSRHSRVGAQVLMSFPIASAARRSAVPLPAPGDRPARHKGPRDPA